MGNYKAFVHLVDAAGTIVSQSDAIPGPGYPTNHWTDNEVVIDRHEVVIPENAQPGAYTLIAGLYDPVSAARLEATSAAGIRYAHDGVPVQEVNVVE